MGFEYKNRRFQYLTSHRALDGKFIVTSATSVNRYFANGSEIEITSKSTPPFRASMEIKGGNHKQTIELIVGTHGRQKCWMFGAGDDDSVFVVYLQESAVGQKKKIIFERFFLGGSELSHLPWAGQVKHDSIVPPAVILNQDDEGSGEEP